MNLPDIKSTLEIMRFQILGYQWGIYGIYKGRGYQNFNYWLAEGWDFIRKEETCTAILASSRGRVVELYP